VLFSGELQIFDQNYSLLVIKSVQNTIPRSFQKCTEFVFRQGKKNTKSKETYKYSVFYSNSFVHIKIIAMFFMYAFQKCNSILKRMETREAGDIPQYLLDKFTK